MVPFANAASSSSAGYGRPVHAQFPRHSKCAWADGRSASGRNQGPGLFCNRRSRESRQWLWWHQLRGGDSCRRRNRVGLPVGQQVPKHIAHVDGIAGFGAVGGNAEDAAVYRLDLLNGLVTFDAE